MRPLAERALNEYVGIYRNAPYPRRGITLLGYGFNFNFETLLLPELETHEDWGDLNHSWHHFQPVTAMGAPMQVFAVAMASYKTGPSSDRGSPNQRLGLAHPGIVVERMIDHHCTYVRETMWPEDGVEDPSISGGACVTLLRSKQRRRFSAWLSQRAQERGISHDERDTVLRSIYINHAPYVIEHMRFLMKR